MRNAPRVFALVAAPLLVVGATAIVMLNRSDAGATPVSPDGPVVTILQPLQGAVLDVQSVQVLARAQDPDGVANAELRVNDKRVASQITGAASTADLQFSWTPDSPGDYTLRVRARDNDGKWGEAVITVSAGTGLPPLPPPPTTAPQSTLAVVTTTVTTPAPPTTPAPTTAAPTSPPTDPPIAPTAPPTHPTVPTTPPTTPPPSTTTTTTTAPVTTPTTTTTTVAVTTTTTATTISPVVTQARCKLDAPAPVAPASHSTLVAQQPTFVWSYAGSCPPTSQLLWISSLAGFQQVRLDGATRAYVLASPLPACTGVRWAVIVYDSNGRGRGSHWSDFTTVGC